MKCLNFKKILLLCQLASLYSVSYGFSQTINGVKVSEIDVEYIQIVGTAEALSDKVTVKIEFGQRHKVLFSYSKDTQIRDENKKLTEFNSMIDALNFMSVNGYEFVQAFALTEGEASVDHYLMRKKK
jgi:hypothetical protein